QFVCSLSSDDCHTHQSPINIWTKMALYDPFLKPLKIQYDPTTSRKIVNLGHCFNVEFDDTSDMSVLSDGPLNSRYRLRQFHFHWGSSDKDGSEHVIDGNVYPAELHIVYWNSQKYESFEEAAKHPDGLAVIGVLLKIGEANPVLQTIIEHLDDVKTKGKEHSFTKYNLARLLPNDLDYWTYHGSLTTEPYFECVTWIVLQRFSRPKFAYMNRSASYSREACASILVPVFL
uniref:Carbonic anhydrase n=1 Tax=Leptobrachium leishanense TaxID=445787 RepID=A0A8C5WI84_9ANUR